jgi:hypothetical protein
MGFVALAAFNLAAMKAVWGRSDRFNEARLMGALPMANAIVVGPLLGDRRRSRGCRRFQLGFQAFGAMALGLYVAGFWLYPDMTGLGFRLFTEPRGPSSDTIDIVVWYAIPLVVVGLSQFVFALLGGWLVRNFRIR